MAETVALSTLLHSIQDTIEADYGYDTYLLKVEITDVKKYEQKKWCFLKFIEKQGDNILAESRGVAWQQGYEAIKNFEQQTNQVFKDGLEIICQVKVSYNIKFGLSLEIVAIDTAYTLGKLVQERELTLQQLLKNYPNDIQVEEDIYTTTNNTLALAPYFKNIALIAAPNSDGERDFLNELHHNKYGYTFKIDVLPSLVQGDGAAANLLSALLKTKNKKYDAVVIVRGGGSNTDFKPFENYNLAAAVATHPIPILCGIGHDRNTSIVDLMSRQLKTPTKVATYIVEYNMAVDRRLLELKEYLKQLAASKIEQAQLRLEHLKSLVQTYHPQTIIKRGYALVYKNNVLVSQPNIIVENDELQIHLKNNIITTKVLNNEEK
jgi:exodeoxyribonuclease VII large subunit